MIFSVRNERLGMTEIPVYSVLCHSWWDWEKKEWKNPQSLKYMIYDRSSFKGLRSLSYHIKFAMTRPKFEFVNLYIPWMERNGRYAASLLKFQSNPFTKWVPFQRAKKGLPDWFTGNTDEQEAMVEDVVEG